MTPRSVGRLKVLVVGSFVAALAACEVPTEAPILESRWILPTDGDATIAVADLLPSDVSLQGGQFVVDIDPTNTSGTLGELCEPCAAVDGLTVPKPAFEGSFESTTDLPGDVSSAVVSGGTVDITVTNEFGFDPLRPGGETGTVIVRIANLTGETLGTLTLDGATDALPSGGQITRSITLSGASVTGIRATVEIDSPAGDPALIRVADRLTATGTIRDLTASSAVVDVSGEAFDIEPTDLDVEDIDSVLTDRIESGAFEVSVENPFGVGAAVTLEITGPFTTISKPLQISASPSSTTRVDFTGEELQRFLGQPNVVIRGPGTVNAANAITVTPDQEIELEIDVDLTLRIGG